MQLQVGVYLQIEAFGGVFVIPDNKLLKIRYAHQSWERTIIVGALYWLTEPSKQEAVMLHGSSRFGSGEVSTDEDDKENVFRLWLGPLLNEE